MGFADHFVPHDRLDAFTETIEADDIDSAVAAFAEEPPPSPLLAQREWIDHCYAGETIADIVAALRGHDAVPANDAADLIASRSPIVAVRHARGGPPGRHPDHPGRRAAPGISNVVRRAYARTI